MGRNNGPQRPSMNESDPQAVPCLSQDSAAAARSYLYLDDDDLRAVPCSFQDDDDAMLPELSLPVNSQDLYQDDPSVLKVMDDLLAGDDYFDCQSSKTNCVSFNEYPLAEDEWFGFQRFEIDWDCVTRSCHGATVSPNCNNPASLENKMNEEYAVNSLPWAPHQSEQCDRLLPTMISDKDNTQTGFYNSFEIGSSSSHPLQIEHSMLGSQLPQKASRPSSSARGQSKSLEPNNLHGRFEVTVPKFFVEVPETASAGFLKKAILEKVTTMELRTNAPIACSINSMATIICSEVNDSLDFIPGCQKVKAFKSKKHLVMDANSLDVSPVLQKSKSPKNEKRRKTEFFSISEVEALVQQVDEHGTGSWAKIKEQAFGQESRRTRMDLRDKWESLLKTVEMPFEKRRGPKLPQELLDRVVAIKNRNSQHQDFRS